MYGYVVKINGRDRDISKGELREKAEKAGYQLYEGSEMGAPDDNTALVGEVLANFDSEDPDNFAQDPVDFEELIDRVNQMKVIKEMFESIGRDSPTFKIFNCF
jgi:hypothetical protein